MVGCLNAQKELPMKRIRFFELCCMIAIVAISVLTYNESITTTGAHSGNDRRAATIIPSVSFNTTQAHDDITTGAGEIARVRNLDIWNARRSLAWLPRSAMARVDGIGVAYVHRMQQFNSEMHIGATGTG